MKDGPVAERALAEIDEDLAIDRPAEALRRHDVDEPAESRTVLKQEKQHTKGA